MPHAFILAIGTEGRTEPGKKLPGSSLVGIHTVGTESTPEMGSNGCRPPPPPLSLSLSRSPFSRLSPLRGLPVYERLKMGPPIIC